MSHSKRASLLEVCVEMSLCRFNNAHSLNRERVCVWGRWFLIWGEGQRLGLLELWVEST